MARSDELYARAKALEEKVIALRAQAAEAKHQELLGQPLLDRMIFAARTRCNCGAGLAYDPASEGTPPMKGPSAWECSDILRFTELSPERQAEVQLAVHDKGFPFAFYEIKSERQPRQGGATTRPAA